MFLLSLWLLASAEGALAAEPPPKLPDVAASCIACGPTAPRPEALLTREHWPNLRGGEILKRQGERVVSEQSTTKINRAFAMIPYSPERVWAVLTDFEEWPRFMPHIRETTVTQSEDQRHWVEQRYRILMSDMQHTTVYDLHPGPGRIEWKLDPARPHDIASTTGSWQLAAVDGGRQTLVTYASSVDAGRSVPQFIEKMLVDRSLSELFDHLRLECDRRGTSVTDAGF
jgi:carbon monoxide dehydrogenase subunit G